MSHRKGISARGWLATLIGLGVLLLLAQPVLGDAHPTSSPGSDGEQPRNLALSQLFASTGSAARSTPPLRRPLPGEKNQRLSWEISRLARADKEARALGGEVTALYSSGLDENLQLMVRERLLRIDGDGRVQVYVVSAGDSDSTARDVRGLGGEVQRLDPAAGLIQAEVPIKELEALGSRASVRFVRSPDYAVLQAGSATTQGDAILKAVQTRTNWTVDGTGVRVGVISDGVGGLGTSQASGDLGPVNTTTCNVIPGSDPQLSGSEGTAMLEIVHDLAPGAELWFGHFWTGTTVLDFNAAVDCLALNTDVVVDDVGFFNVGPYDGTSVISANTSTELDNNANRIRVYSTSVGNSAERHYQEAYVACSGGTEHQFQATGSTADQGAFGPRCDTPLFVPAGGMIRLFLEWNDPFGASCNDYDMYLYGHDTANLITSSFAEQSCFQNPVEAIVWQNTGGDTLVDVVIDNFQGLQDPRTFDLFTLGAFPNFVTPGSSVSNQSDAGGGVISVGAIHASDPGNDTIASYSSLGPTNDGRTKPDVTAIDCVSITGAGGFPNPFCGTSAAAPHIAGIAALLLHCRPALKSGEPGDNPSADRTALRNGILNFAVGLGAPGVDNVYGSGRADALATANSICAPATPTPTPSPTAAPNAFGNVDCQGGINSIDALKLLRYGVSLTYTQAEPCEDIGLDLLPNGELQGDVDCTATVNSIDALKLLRYTAGLTYTQTEPCPDIGTLP
jgi:hypothetical protein